MTNSLVEEIQGRSRQYLGAAKVAWGQWVNDDRLKAEGHAEVSAGRAQERGEHAHGEAENTAKASGEPKA